MVQRKQENLDYISAALRGLKEVTKETALNYPSQIVTKKDTMGQSGIDVFKYRKDFQFGKQFHTTHFSKYKYLTPFMFSSNPKSLNNQSFLLSATQAQLWWCQMKNTEFNWHCQASGRVQKLTEESSEVNSWIMMRRWTLRISHSCRKDVYKLRLTKVKDTC